MTKPRHSKHSAARKTPRIQITTASLRWRGTVIALLASLVASLFCLGFLGTLVEQIKLMVPRGAANPAEQQGLRAAQEAWQKDRQIQHAIGEFYFLSTGNPSREELDRWAQAASDNSLPLWADLLVRLRQAGIEPYTPASTQPTELSTGNAVDEGVSKLLRDLEYAPPLRVAVQRLEQASRQAVMKRGVSARRAEGLLAAQRWSNVLSAYRPVLRELTGRLLALGREYRQAGRTEDADRALHAVIRIWTNVVADSPVPEVALLAAAGLEQVLHEYEGTTPGTGTESTGVQGASGTRAASTGGQAASGTGPESTGGQAASGTDIQSLRAGLEQFRRAWVEVPDHQLAVAPPTFSPSFAPQAERTMLASLRFGTGALAVGWMLGVLCLVLLAVIVVRKPYGQVPVRWRMGGWAVVLAPAIVVLPMLVLISILSSDLVPFIWLISRPVGWVLLVPAALILLWMVAVHSCLVPDPPFERAVLPAWLLLGGLAVPLIGAVLAAVFVPNQPESWQPPRSIQILRYAGWTVGLTAVLVVLAWAELGRRQRRRTGLTPGAWARAGLAVAAGAMAVMLVAAAIALAVNSARDRRHEAAFAQATVDPLATRAGSQWQETYFSPVRALID